MQTTTLNPTEALNSLGLGNTLSNDIVQTIMLETEYYAFEFELWLDIETYYDQHPCNPDRMIKCYELHGVDQAHLIGLYDEDGQDVAYTLAEQREMERIIETENHFEIEV